MKLQLKNITTFVRIVRVDLHGRMPEIVDNNGREAVANGEGQGYLARTGLTQRVRCRGLEPKIFVSVFKLTLQG